MMEFEKQREKLKALIYNLYVWSNKNTSLTIIFSYSKVLKNYNYSYYWCILIGYYEVSFVTIL